MPALRRGLDVLELLGASEEPLSAYDIGHKCGIPRSGLYEILRVLQEGRFVSAVAGGYALGPQVAVLGSSYLDRIDLVAHARRATERLTEETGDTSQVALLDGREVVYVAKSDSRHQIRLISSVGRRLPACCTALGKAMLSRLQDDEVQALYADQAPERLTDRSLGIEALLDDLSATRVRSYAVERGESNENVACIAVPLVTLKNQPRAALSVSVLMATLTPERERALVEAAARAAEAFAEGLGVASTETRGIGSATEAEAGS